MIESSSEMIEIEEFTDSIQQISLKVKNGEMSLTEISLLEIIKKYLSYIIMSHKDTIDLDIAANFLVSVSNLILWKSNLLLPFNQEQTDDEFEEDKMTLQEEYWKEYKKYQSLISIFEDKKMNQEKIYLTYLHPNIENEEQYQENHFSELVLAIESILSRQHIKPTMEVKKRHYNIEQKMKEIEDYFNKNDGRLSFQQMISRDCQRIEIIVIFLALLELICQGKIDYMQSKNFGDILFYRKGDKILLKR